MARFKCNFCGKEFKDALGVHVCSGVKPKISFKNLGRKRWTRKP